MVLSSCAMLGDEREDHMITSMMLSLIKSYSTQKFYKLNLSEVQFVTRDTNNALRGTNVFQLGILNEKQ